MNSFVACPHCRQQIGNDGSLSGQVVACPHCRGQFTMPGIPVAPVVSAPFVSVNTGSTYSPRNKSKPILLWIAGGAIALLVLPCFACGLLGVLVDKGERSNPSPQRRTTNRNIEAEQAAIEAEGKRRIQEIGLGPKVTYANFTRITNGMSKDEVCDILGFEYEIVSEAGSGKFKTEMLAWKGDLIANCNVMFQNDKVISKAQLGLK